MSKKFSGNTNTRTFLLNAYTYCARFKGGLHLRQAQYHMHMDAHKILTHVDKQEIVQDYFRRRTAERFEATNSTIVLEIDDL